MSSAPDFPTNNNPSIISDGYDHAQLAPPPEIEGRKNTSELSLADNGSEVKAAPNLKGVVPDNRSGANLSYQTTSGKSAPGVTDICPKNPSVVDEESANTTPVNPQDVGRKMREVNLTEYYVKKK